jgi:hypothetical protein
MNLPSGRPTIEKLSALNSKQVSLPRQMAISAQEASFTI